MENAPMLLRSRFHNPAWYVKKFGYGPYGMNRGGQKADSAGGSHHTKKILKLISGSRHMQKFRGGDSLYFFDVFHPLAGTLDGLRILHISDTHFSRNPVQKRTLDVLKNISQEHVDIIVHTGDIINWQFSEVQRYHFEFLQSLCAPLGKFFVLGNHDYYDTAHIPALLEWMEKAGFTILHNCSKLLKKNGVVFNLVGVDDPILGRPDFKTALHTLSENNFTILLIHCLDGLTSAVPEVFDMVLSGHVHAGECDLGIVNGTDILLLQGNFINLNNHWRGFKFLTDKTLSYIHPGTHAYMKEVAPYLPRLGTEKSGVAILTLRKYPAENDYA